HEHRADRLAQMRGIRPFENAHTKRHAQRRAQQERPQPLPMERRAQFPDRISLNDQAKRDDQGRGLQRRQNVEPDRGRDQTEGKAGESSDQSRGKGCREKQRKHADKVDIEAAHAPYPRMEDAASFGCAVATRGKASVKRAPPPGLSVTLTLPPCTRMISATMARPRPAPSFFSPAPRQNRLKMFARSPGRTPPPRSATSMRPASSTVTVTSDP